MVLHGLSTRHHIVSSFPLFSFVLVAFAQSPAPSSILPAPGQPKLTGTLGGFEIHGNSMASAQQMFLGTAKTAYILDKAENNPPQINGHPVWASEYHIDTDDARPMEVVTNTFCAGGNVLGNGTWLNVGGNQAVTYGGNPTNLTINSPPYQDADGGHSLLDPCDDQSCNWVDKQANDLTTRRWYPSVETLEDGSVIIIGGNTMGGFVNAADTSNPTYEFFPTRGDPIHSPLLDRTLPANLFPHTFLLPSGKLFLQLNWATSLLDYRTNAETPLDDIPDAVRTYPASAGVAMLPMTPGNNWTATILFCGGTNLEPDQWVDNWNMATYPTSTSCVTITPDVSGSYTHEDPLPEGRSITNAIMLPNSKLLLLNGANTGVSGYGNKSWSIGQSYADHPVLTPVVFDPSAPSGQKWSREGLSASTVPRLYHSSAILLVDGSVLVAGSNPNADYTTGVPYPTEFRVERFYPPYYNQRRPEPQGLLASYSYGGPYFNVSLSKDDLFGDVRNVVNACVVIIRPGFSTHALNMGQRFVQLDSTYSANADGSAVLYVSQVPPNPAILVPGPAYVYVVVNGVPSIGQQVMIGSGKIETQQVLPPIPLPSSSMLLDKSDPNTDPSNDPSNGKHHTKSAARPSFSISRLHRLSLLLTHSLLFFCLFVQ
ncbi:glyoxal oxidase [Rickenella mellea]|uniref:Glyoxal oxidase n=1 Tax=Rickenella mellea TaxID=50990 RepID=A0A4Y7Q246_9AGAM|nr:glyoxal oxidase [Rickenella mellea]